MGSSSSKAAQGAARKFPTRAPGAAPTSAAAAAAAAARTEQPRSRPQAKASTSKTEDILADSISPDHPTAAFSSRLQQMGVVQPNPTFSPTSIAGSLHDTNIQSPGPLFPSTSRNATLVTLEARRTLQQRADEEFEGLGRADSRGREFLDLHTIVQIHRMRDSGHPPEQIAQRLNLKEGVIERLGRPGITSVA
ncbi:hypothetical protein CMUS01_04862 [Colletotrichum musicola]|uniref:Helix-turn-helix domain-containing protein n=1 Tax=Colletotrichum musicola TaxID=2175873 RepID=A0A8H6KUM9_9PEZI|nr:hypothetical protein CMUS01_04862 [Colletotrichum musicola]